MTTRVRSSIYNESKYGFIRSNSVCHLGNSQVEGDEKYKHLGVINNKYLSFKTNIKDAVDKLKSLSIVIYFMRTHFIL